MLPGVLLVASIFLGISCGHDTPAVRETIADARIEPQEVVALDANRRPNARVDTANARKYREPLDADSVELVEYNGGRYHWPVDMCHRAFEFLNAYRLTGDREFVRRAEKVARALNAIAISSDSAWFCQYLFEYRLHADIIFTPPWYSGMAQGEWAELLTRLYEATGDSTYLSQARSVFESLLIIGPRQGPWVARIDSAGYYWIEEFPDSARPGMTLNGFIAALFGVYDYYQASGDERAKQVLDASLTTIKHYAGEFRRPGAFSYYCIGHKSVANRSYHDLHASMMRHLYRMTDDPFFQAMSDSLEADGAAVGDGGGGH